MTMIFHVGNVNIERLKESIRDDRENFVVRSYYDFKYLAISGFFKEENKLKWYLIF